MPLTACSQWHLKAVRAQVIAVTTCHRPCFCRSHDHDGVVLRQDGVGQTCMSYEKSFLNRGCCKGADDSGMAGLRELPLGLDHGLSACLCCPQCRAGLEHNDSSTSVKTKSGISKHKAKLCAREDAVDTLCSTQILVSSHEGVHFWTACCAASCSFAMRTYEFLHLRRLAPLVVHEALEDPAGHPVPAGQGDLQWGPVGRQVQVVLVVRVWVALGREEPARVREAAAAQAAPALAWAQA
mmetsp:Transcript_11328/g.31867  ORF Transcript_11328/g.31867 Transcript_11328/m.31867 type:complete len:239 (+) Transcript_11328:261-977(+)